jgi:hypothetical protein
MPGLVRSFFGWLHSGISLVAGFLGWLQRACETGRQQPSRGKRSHVLESKNPKSKIFRYPNFSNSHSDSPNLQSHAEVRAARMILFDLRCLIYVPLNFDGTIFPRITRPTPAAEMRRRDKAKVCKGSK